MGIIDILIFIVFIVGVVALGLWKSKSEPKKEVSSDAKDAAKDYFLAGGSLPWWVIGFSLIAANISTEQFVGMSGKAADWLGMAIASYEWLAAITLVVVAFVFLPKFLKSGIYTIPEFLEHRYDPVSRVFMAIATMIILVGVPTASVIYSGATIMNIFFQGQCIFGISALPVSITMSCWIIGILATTYVFAGGLKACAWADLIQGSALIVGGAIVTYLGLATLGAADVSTLVAAPDCAPMLPEIPNYPIFGYESLLPDSVANMNGIERMWELNQAKFHMVLPITDPEIPWTALILGLWIPNFFYWGLNQYITQRTLGAKSLNEGQKGIVFAAGMKLIIPFVIVMIGIIAFNLYEKDLNREGRWQSAIVLAQAPELLKNLDPKFSHEYIAANEQDTAIIVQEIQDALKATPARTPLFKFDKNFAALHIKDAVKIYGYNVLTTGAVDTAFPNMETVLAGADTALKTGLQADALLFGNSLAVLNAKVIEKPTAMQSVFSISGYRYDMTYGTVLKKLVKGHVGIAGFVLASIFGAVVSSLASMLNSAATLFTMDIFHKMFKRVTHNALVWCGRIMTIVFALIACLIAPHLGAPQFNGIFTFIQEFQGFISPGVLAVFVFGLLVARAPRSCGLIGLGLSPILYALCKWGDAVVHSVSNAIGIEMVQVYDFFHWIAQRSFLDRMSFCFITILIVLALVTMLRPLKEPVTLPCNEKMDMTTTFGTKLAGWIVVIATLVLYFIFC